MDRKGNRPRSDDNRRLTGIVTALRASGAAGPGRNISIARQVRECVLVPQKIKFPLETAPKCLVHREM